MANPLIQKIPGRVFQLPSRGSLYTTELAPTVVNGELEVFPVPGITELNLKNPDLLFNGSAITRVFNECVPGILEPLKLASKDVDAVLFFLRLATYGNQFQIEVDHGCREDKKLPSSYVVDLDKVLFGMKKLDPTTFENDRTVLVNGYTIITRPIRFNDMVELFQKAGNKVDPTSDEIRNLTIFNLMTMIESVNDITDQSQIEEWIMTLTTPQINKIVEAASKLNDWGIDSKTKIICRECGEEMNVELPLNPINFFTE